MSCSRVAGTASTFVLGLSLASCGGTGGGIASTPPSVPAAVSGPTYQTLDQITGDHTYQTAGISTSFGPPAPVGLGLKDSASLDFDTGIDIVYSAADHSYTLTDPNGTHVTFTPADIVPSDPGVGGVKYRVDIPNNQLVHYDFARFVPKVNGVSLSYTFMGIWYQDYGQVINVMVGGVPTQTGDLPTSGSANYQAALVSGAALTSGAATYDLGGGGSTATFSADFGSGTVQTTIGLRGMDSRGATNDLGTLTGDGTISATAPTFAGTLSQTGGSGAFSGAFLGPQAAEMGYGFYFDSADFTAIGLVAGKKK